MSSQLGIPHNEKIVTPTITPMAERGGGAVRGGLPFGLLLLVVAMFCFLHYFLVGVLAQIKITRKAIKTDVVNYRN